MGKLINKQSVRVNMAKAMNFAFPDATAPWSRKKYESEKQKEATGQQ